jgi:hypothetical protein
MVVEREQALLLVQEMLAQLSPGEKVKITRENGILTLRGERSVDPEMMDRVKAVSEKYHDVFQKLARS